MTGITHRSRRIYEKWKQDTLSQSDFRPSVSILKLSFMAIFVGIAAALVAWLLYRMIGLVTHLAFAGQRTRQHNGPQHFRPARRADLDGGHLFAHGVTLKCRRLPGKVLECHYFSNQGGVPWMTRR